MATIVATAEGALRAQPLESLGELEPDDWDALVPCGSGPLKHGYLSAWEKVELRGLCSRPIVAYVNGSGRPVAACPGYFYQLDIPLARSPGSGRPLRAIRRLFPDFLVPRTYELGSPAPLTSPFLLPDNGLRPPSIRTLVEAALEEAKEGDAELVLVQNFTAPSGPVGRQLEQLGFVGVPIPPTGVLSLPYDSFEVYLGAMRAPYRRRARKMLKHAEELRAEHLHHFGDLADELARLWRLTYERASEVKREILTPAFFRAASEVDEVTVLVMRRPAGSIASFALLMDDHPWLSFLQCGFEAEAGRREGAYFRLLYEIVRLGIQGGFEQIDLGMTTLEPKFDLGAVPVPLFAWVRHRNPVLQRILQAVARGPLRPPRLEPRRVFKEPAPSGSDLVEQRGLPT